MNGFGQRRRVVSWVVAVLLAGCGGGEGDASPPPIVDTAAPTAVPTAPVALATGLTDTLALTATAVDNVGVAPPKVATLAAARPRSRRSAAAWC